MKLNAARRNKLKQSQFGLPSERKYPMPDPQHAALAKGRAKQALAERWLTHAQYDEIVRKANAEEAKG